MGGPLTNVDDARTLAQGALDLLYLGDDVVIDDRSTIEHEHGWTFFYETRAFLASGAEEDGLTGAGPLVVDRRTARVLQAGTWQRWEDLVDAMQEYDR